MFLITKHGSPSGARVTTPIAVDLEGTLLHTNLIWEGVAILLRERPWMLPVCCWWLLRGKLYFKQRLAQHTDIQWDLLPWNRQALDYLRMESFKGRLIYLMTDVNRIWAEQASEYLDLFHSVFASTDRHDNSGENKRLCCLLVFGEQGYDYLGDAYDDLPAMRSAQRVMAVGTDIGFPVLHRFPAREATLPTLARALRMELWGKNLLAFVPAFVGLQWSNPTIILQSLTAALALSFTSSAGYLINDIFDLRSDRTHPSKSNRPLASGALSIPLAILLILLMTAAAAVCTVILPAPFRAVLAIYLAASLSYTFWLKRLLMADITMLAALCTLRVFAGNAATGIPTSHWLLLFTLFVFTSLAIVRRSADVSKPYSQEDIPLLGAMGVASAMLSVLVIGLYIQSETAAQLYRLPVLLWPVCVMLVYWFSRLFLLARRQSEGCDPFLFALRDPGSYFALSCITASMASARFL